MNTESPLSQLSVVLAGGGTAGHISPLLAIANAVREARPDVRLLAVGTPGGMEARLVPAAGLDLVTISRVPFPRRPSLDLLRLPGRLAGAVKQAGVILEEAKADVLVGVGGYVCTPMYLAARRRRIPIVIHEANTRPGLANRVGALLGGHVAVAFAATRLGASRHVGMPMRKEISGLDRAAARTAARAALGLDPDRPALIVTGGSSGAQSINRTMAASVGLLADAGIQTLHITGRGKAVHDADGKPLAAPGYRQLEYVDGMETVYAAADLLLARSGAATVCEVAAVGLPAVFVPLPIGNGEQALNAAGLVEAGGALLVEDSTFSPGWVSGHIIPLLQDPARLAQMADSAGKLGIRDADRSMADLVLQAAAGQATSVQPVKPVKPAKTAGSSRAMTQPEHQQSSTAARSAESLGRTHFIGIGGVGMSAVARIMVARGLPVSGSDAKDLPVMTDLSAAGARICVGYDAANLGDAQSVVAGSAIRQDNPELAAARAAGLPVLHRSEALAAAMAQDTAVTVAGTHGKSTTTSMIAVLLQGAGLDPSFAIGANVPALGVNAASGSSPVFVAEADESDGSFLNYRPQIAVVTNVEPDHLDHYGTAEAVYASFDRFTALLPADGVLVACADDPGARALALRTLERGNTRVVLYGTSGDAQLVLHDGGPGDVAITTPAGRFPLELHVPGRHNALNAAAAFAVALELGIDPAVAAGALTQFTGASRRFEFKGEGRGVRVYDDYAHHPTEVRAALAAARSVAGGHKLHVLFQPHLFSRTREFAEEFAAALNAADTALVLDIYPAREDPIPGVSSQLIAAHLGAGGRLVGPGSEAVQAIVSAAAPGDIVITVGAGDVTAYGPLIVAALNGALNHDTAQGGGAPGA